MVLRRETSLLNEISDFFLSTIQSIKTAISECLDLDLQSATAASIITSVYPRDGLRFDLTSNIDKRVGDYLDTLRLNAVTKLC